MILAAASLVGLLVYGVVQNGEDRTIDDKLASGTPVTAPARSLPLLGGTGSRSLADYRGKPVVVNFWASWCEPCRAEAPLLQKAHERLAKAGGLVLGVDYKDTTEAASKFVEEFGVTYPIVRDFEGKLAPEYGTRALPETFLVDRTGRIIAVKRGQLDREWLDTNLPRALKQ